MKWIDANVKPVPRKNGVKCDRFLVQYLYGAVALCYFFYDEGIWTEGTGDEQKVLRWYRYPDPPTSSNKG